MRLQLKTERVARVCFVDGRRADLLHVAHVNDALMRVLSCAVSSVCVCVCVCVCERERERERESVCVCVRVCDRETPALSIFVHPKKRKRLPEASCRAP